MKLQNLTLENFRNHKSTSFDCSQGVNVFLGDNGEGKTNILEGISYLCLSKSFYAANDSIVMNVERNDFHVKGNFLSDADIKYYVLISYFSDQKKKEVTVNKSKIEKASALIGQFPIVILAPEQNMITLGPPADRRRFVDFIIAQSSRAYLENLLDYRKILKHRNIILSEIRSKKTTNKDLLEPWNTSLLQTGTTIMLSRKKFTDEFKSVIKHAYRQLAGESEKPDMFYEPSVKMDGENIDYLKNKFNSMIEKNLQEDLQTGFTSVGPHRDEFVFTVNNLQARSHASQGQHKTLLVALKIAEFFYLKERCSETPILLMDDVLSELDMNRSQRLLEETSKLGQIFITSTDERALKWLPVTKTESRKIYINKGKIDYIENIKHV